MSRNWQSPEFKSPGAENENAYTVYLRERKKYNEGKTSRYTGYLNNVARLIDTRLAPDMVRTQAGIIRIMAAVAAAANAENAKEKDADPYAALTPKLISKHRTALFHYCRALNKSNPG